MGVLTQAIDQYLIFSDIVNDVFANPAQHAPKAHTVTVHDKRGFLGFGRKTHKEPAIKFSPHYLLLESGKLGTTFGTRIVACDDVKTFVMLKLASSSFNDMKTARNIQDVITLLHHALR